MDATDNDFYINSGKNNVLNSAESNLMTNEIVGMVDKLDDSLRIPFIMHFQGFKYQEIAEELDLPLGTVKSQIFFARKEMKDLINKRYDNMANLRSKDK